jgi:cathepsin D
VSLTFSGTSWDINPAALNVGQIQGDPTNCLLGIAEDPVNSGFWIVGETFLQNVYVAFDLDFNQVGFAKQA